MGGRRAVLCVLALLAAGIAEVTAITLESMTWDDASVLTVCATEEQGSAVAVHLTVKHSDNSETNYEGDTVTEDPWTCATFVDVPGPEAETTTYELAVGFTDNSVQQGLVKFAFPLSEGMAIECETSKFGRFSITDTSYNLSASCLPTSDSCYFAVTDLSSLCVPGLDHTVGNEAFTVCVPSSGEASFDDNLITDVRFTYDVGRTTGSFTILPSIITDTQTQELLCTVDDPDHPIISQCDANVCDFVDLAPSTNLYQLCSVNNDGTTFTVDTSMFHDVMLTVGRMDTTIDFAFANVGNNGDFAYKVYGGVVATSSRETFTLNCSHIAQDSFCNGFFDNTALRYIGVAFVGVPGHVVIAPVSSSVGYKKNATTFDNTKTENIVPISV